MEYPALPRNEPHRLVALEQTGLLDTPIEERFERVTRMACKVLNMPIAAISLVDLDRQWFKSIQGLCVAETSRSVSFCGHTILTPSELTVVRDARLDHRFSSNPLVTGDPHIVFYAGCPLTTIDGNPVGSLCIIDRWPRDLRADEIQVLTDLAAWATTEIRAQFLSSIQNELVTQIGTEQRQAMLDPLTRLWNRRGMDQLLQLSQGKADQTAGSLGLIMLDIDHFKRINDTYGHATGDDVLREVGKRILRAVRPNDAVGRTGGEEFLAVLPEVASRERLVAVVDRIIAGVNAQPVKTDAGFIEVTISAGAVLLADERDDIDAMIKVADEALYEAKRTGRNRAVIADNPTSFRAAG